VWRFLKRLKIEPAYDPAASLLGTHLKKCKSAHKTDACPLTFIAALSAKLQSRPGAHPPTNGLRKCGVNYMEYYSAIKKGGVMSFAGKRMELEIITLSEISQTDKDKYLMSFSYVESSPYKNE
jgi:hypothetical protein